MARWVTIFSVATIGGLFWWAVPLLRLFDAFQPMITALSIMVAAVFVRLSRGMPTMEWKSVDPDERKQLTSQIVALSKEYSWIIAINALALIGLVALAAVGKCEVAALWPAWLQRLTAGLIGAFGALCIARMTYVVWRDVDVVTLQKHLIDGTAVKDLTEIETQSANDKVAIIKAAGLRTVAKPPPKQWDE